MFEEGLTAIQYAAFGGHNHTLDFLVAKGLKLDAKDNIGSTAIHYAARGGHNLTLDF